MSSLDSEQSSYDDRPLVDDLLEKHAKAITSVRESILADDECKDLYAKGDNTTRYDDIWILRYVLTHKGSAKYASKAAISTIKFRDKVGINKLGDIRHRLKQHGNPDSEAMANIEPLPGYELFNKYCGENAVSLTLPDKNRGLIMYCAVGAIDQHGIAENIDENTLKDLMMYGNEAMFQVVDEITRRTGRLTKMTKILDMGNASLRGINRTYIKRDAVCSKALEDNYPQLLA
ncbi:MAG: hypothetical protein SGBAC_005934, partial [Bacillariaceae sp.]